MAHLQNTNNNNNNKQIKENHQAQQQQQDSNKEEKLYNFLTKALDDYDNGERKHLNLLQEEVCQKNKDVGLLKMWMNCFMKKIFNNAKLNPSQLKTQLQQQEIKENQTKILIELILYKMPFLDTEGNGQNNHLQILPVFEKFLLQLISFQQNVYIKIIISHLVDKLIPDTYNELSIGKMNEQVITICKEKFDGKQEVLNKVKLILSNYNVFNLNDSTPLEKQDEQFLLEVFKCHPNAGLKMKNLKSLCVGQQIYNGKSTKLFFIQKKDGSREDISYLKSVSNMFEMNYINARVNFNSQEKLKIINDFIIQLLSKIVKIYPLQQKSFLTILQEKYPHKIQNQESHKIYMISLLKIAQQHQILFKQICSLIIQKLIEIDAEIKIDSNQILSDNMLSIEERQNMIDQMAKKLDWLMLIFFQYIDSQFNTENICKEEQSDKNNNNNNNSAQKNRKRSSSFQLLQQQQQGSNSKKNSLQIQQKNEKQLQQQQQYNNLIFKDTKKPTKQQQKKLFNSILEIFQKEILVAHECKFVQFLLFKLCKLDSEYCQEFLSLLIKQILIKTDKTYIQTKINSTFYLMSFVARASFLDTETVWKSLQWIMEYIKDYLENNKDRQGQTLDRPSMIKEHQMLYYNLQMIFYIILYRHKNLKKENILEMLDFLESILEQSFQALNFIQHQVVAQFLTMLKQQYKSYHNLINIFQEAHDYNQILTSQKFSSPLEKARFQLYIYYPFDPYLLSYSEKYIKDDYLQWDDGKQYRQNAQLNNINNNSTIRQSPNSTTHSDPSEINKDDEYDDDVQQDHNSEEQYQNSSNNNINIEQEIQDINNSNNNKNNNNTHKNSNSNNNIRRNSSGSIQEKIRRPSKQQQQIDFQENFDKNQLIQQQQQQQKKKSVQKNSISSIDLNVKRKQKGSIDEFQQNLEKSHKKNKKVKNNKNLKIQ